MSTGFTLIVLAEVALLLFIVWGWMHESIFINFERKAARKIRKAVRKTKRYIKAFFLCMLIIPLEKEGFRIEKK